MKSKIVAISVVLGMILNGAIDLYPETAKVRCIDYDKDLVTVETATGNRFQFYGAEDYDVNNIVSMLMYGNNTPEVKDDIILDVNYSGYEKEDFNNGQF